MEKLANCEIVLDIEMIENISGANQRFEVTFMCKDKTKYKLIFDWVWDMRYSIENASIDRFCQFRKSLTAGLAENSIYVVEDSEYIKYFERQVSGTRPMDEIKHYIITDGTDTTLDVLTVKEPKLIKI